MGSWGGDDYDDGWGGNDDDGFDAGDAAGDIGKSFCSFCCGIFLIFPLAVFLTGWNEQAAVCREWAIDQSKEKLDVLSLDSNTKTKDGKTIMPGDLGFITGTLDESTYKDFTSKSFSGLTSIPENLLFDGVDGIAKGAAMSMNVQMYQCVEKCVRYSCDHRRLDESDETESDQRHLDESDETESGEQMAEEKRALLNRRLDNDGEGHLRNLKSKGKRGQQSCNKRCVEYAYERKLSGVQESQTFHADPKPDCGPLAGQLTFPSDPKLGETHEHAAAGAVKFTGGAWSLNTKQLHDLPIDAHVPLKARAATATPDKSFPLTEKNTVQTPTQLLTCPQGTAELGCLVIEFKAAKPPKATILSAVSEDAGLFKEEGWEANGYWLCSGHGANNFNRICPAATSLDINKGITACGPEIDTVDELVEKMASENSTKMWILRLTGFICFWCAISMCFQPIETILEVGTDCIDAATDCIPCVGCIVDTMTDIFMGVVRCVLCIVSFCCGGACFLFVVAVMWVVMRPVQGIIMFVVMVGLCIGGYCLLNATKDPDRARNKKFNRGGGE